MKLINSEVQTHNVGVQEAHRVLFPPLVRAN